MSPSLISLWWLEAARSSSAAPLPQAVAPEPHEPAHARRASARAARWRPTVLRASVKAGRRPPAVPPTSWRASAPAISQHAACPLSSLRLDRAPGAPPLLPSLRPRPIRQSPLSPPSAGRRFSTPRLVATANSSLTMKVIGFRRNPTCPAAAGPAGNGVSSARRDGAMDRSGGRMVLPIAPAADGAADRKLPRLRRSHRPPGWSDRDQPHSLVTGNPSTRLRSPSPPRLSARTAPHPPRPTSTSARSRASAMTHAIPAARRRPAIESARCCLRVRTGLVRFPRGPCPSLTALRRRLQPVRDS